MRKQIFASLLLLVLLLGGCAEVSTAPTSMNTEPTLETRAATEKSGENSLSFSGSRHTEAPEKSEAPESTDIQEKATDQAPAETASQPETQKQTAKPSQSDEPTAAPSVKPPAETQPVQAPTETPKETPPAETTPPPAQTQPPMETQPQPTPEETQPKSAYDYEFDIEAIKADCIAIGQGMGLSLDSSLTPNSATWWNPVTASQSNQGTALKQSLESYITFHTAANLSAYGMDEITSFNIYCEARGNGVYSIYFLFA